MEAEISPTNTPEEADTLSTSVGPSDQNEIEAPPNEIQSKSAQSSETVQEPDKGEEGEVAWNNESSESKTDNAENKSPTQAADPTSHSEEAHQSTEASTAPAAKAASVASTGTDGADDGQLEEAPTPTTDTKTVDSEAKSDFDDADMERLLGEPVDLEVLAKSAENEESEDDFEIADEPSPDSRKSRPLLSSKFQDGVK